MNDYWKLLIPLGQTIRNGILEVYEENRRREPAPEDREVERALQSFLEPFLGRELKRAREEILNPQGQERSYDWLPQVLKEVDEPLVLLLTLRICRLWMEGLRDRRWEDDDPDLYDVDGWESTQPLGTLPDLSLIHI